MNKDSLKVLIVDDEQGIRRSLSVFLEDEGMEIETANSAPEVLLKENINSFNLSIVDIRMPDFSGDKLIIKLHELNKNMKFIIYTGSQQFSISPQLQEIGLSNDMVLYKPLEDLKELSNLIKKLCY